MKPAAICITTSIFVAVAGLVLEPFVHWQVVSELAQSSNPTPAELTDRIASIAWVHRAGWIMIGLGVVGTIAGMFWLIASREKAESP